jgi:hypothetical protein
VGVDTGVNVRIGGTVGVSVNRGVGVAVRSTVGVGVAIGVNVGVTATVGVSVNLAVGVAVGAPVGVKVTVAGTVGVATGVGVPMMRVCSTAPAVPWSQVITAALVTVLPPQMLYVFRSKARQLRECGSTVPKVQVSSSGLPGRKYTHSRGDHLSVIKTFVSGTSPSFTTQMA